MNFGQALEALKKGEKICRKVGMEKVCLYF